MSAPAERTTSARLIGTLAGFGALAGLLIVVAFLWADPRILAHKAAVLDASIQEVLLSPARTTTLFLHDGTLSTAPPAGADTTALEKAYAGYDANGRLVGYAIIAAAPGFADVITLIYGYDADRKSVIGMKVLDNKETPGLGDKIVKDSLFVREFLGVTTPLRGVKRGAGAGAAGEVDLITGATISSRTVVAIINRSLEKWAPLLAAARAGGAR